MNILVAEDNLLNQKLVHKLLTNEGYSVKVVENGLAAVEAFEREGPFQCILMDLHMPEMDGAEAAKKIRSMPSGQHVPIIALSGESDLIETVDKFTELFNASLSKPLTKGSVGSLIFQLTMSK